jgi:hypothetical protein
MATRLKTLSSYLVPTVLFLANPAGTAYAAPLFPEILYDSRLGPGQNIYTTQGLHYTAGFGWAVSAKAISISFDGVNVIPLVDGTVDFHSRFVSSSASDGFVHAEFTGVFGPLPDLIVADETGILMGTNYNGRTGAAEIGSTVGTTTSSYVVISGSLAPFFDQTQMIGRNDGVLFNIDPPFSEQSYANDFDGHIAGIISPVAIAEPGTLALLGLGILTLSKYRRRLRSP